MASTQAAQGRTNGGNNSSANELREKAEVLREDISEVASMAKQAAQEKVTEFQRAGGEQLHRLEERINKDPLTSVLIAGGIGFLVGLLYRR